jgi:hypothetical protein
LSCGLLGFGRILGEGNLTFSWFGWLGIDISEVEICFTVSALSSVFGFILIELLIEFFKNGIVAFDEMSFLMNRLYLFLVHLLVFRTYLLF